MLGIPFAFSHGCAFVAVYFLADFMTALSNVSTPYAGRRAALARQMGANAIAVIPTAPEQPRNRDSDFPYRHDSYFYYLTGFTEPGACLVITADGRSTLFCQPKDLEREIWDGYRLGPVAAPAALAVDAAHSISELDAKLPRLLENSGAVWYPFATHNGLAARVEGWLNAVRARARYGALCPAVQNDLCTLLDEMRLVKDAHEQAIMRRASAISAGAHIRVLGRKAKAFEERADRGQPPLVLSVDARRDRVGLMRPAAHGKIQLRLEQRLVVKDHDQVQHRLGDGPGIGGAGILVVVLARQPPDLAQVDRGDQIGRAHV